MKILKTKEAVWKFNAAYELFAYAAFTCSVAFATYVFHDICKTRKGDK